MDLSHVCGLYQGYWIQVLIAFIFSSQHLRLNGLIVHSWSSLENELMQLCEYIHLGLANTTEKILWTRFLSYWRKIYFFWMKGLNSCWVESSDPCNLHFMANLRVYFGWLTVTFLSPSIRNRSHIQHTPFWNIDFLFLKSYSGLALIKVLNAKLPSHQTKWKWVSNNSDTLVWPPFHFAAWILMSTQLKQS